MKPYIVLGTYDPSQWRASIIGQELVAFTKKKGFVPHYSPPMLKKQEWATWSSKMYHASVVRWAVPTYEGVNWHQDGDNVPGANINCGLVLWANRDPTEIKFSGDSKIYTPQPFEVVAFDNVFCYHRRNPYLEGKRWLFRQRVAMPAFSLPKYKLDNPSKVW